jgi:hypothetical protein
MAGDLAEGGRLSSNGSISRCNTLDSTGISLITGRAGYQVRRHRC